MSESFLNLPHLFSSAYHWLCKSRKNHPPDSDIWNLKRTWHGQAEAIMELFKFGTYQFDVQAKITLSSGDTIALWSSRDALITKVLTGIIQEKLKPFLLKTCYHLKGHGGLKGAVRDVMKQLPKYKFFCKTDVRFYYDSIDHYTMLMKLHDYIGDRIIIGYVWQFLNRCVEWGGLYQDIKKGIPRGSSLSPLLGAFYLMELDQEMEKLDVKYFRYMDDILILAPTRWKLRKAIRVLNQTFSALKLEKHPDKTLIGKTERGFDFLGYQFHPSCLTVASKTLKQFVERARQLYEQEPGKTAASSRLGVYVKRWVRWLHAGLPSVSVINLFDQSLLCKRSLQHLRHYTLQYECRCLIVLWFNYARLTSDIADLQNPSLSSRDSRCPPQS